VPSRRSAAAGSVPRIVADTNVYISAPNFAGTADEVLALGRAGVIEVFISPAILEEIEIVLVRKFRWAPPRVREAVRAIRRFAALVNPGNRSTSCETMSPTIGYSNAGSRPAPTRS
jgi:predicted nucleic acid-binding protein